VNDLDLELINITTGEAWKPWVLSSFPHTDSIQKPAVRKKDNLNNAEQVTLDDPAPGNYRLTVNGTAVTSVQDFHIAYQLDSTSVFEWTFPSASDFIFPSLSNMIRWNSSFSGLQGKLEYSTDNGSVWQTIDNPVNLSNGYYKWIPPAIVSTAMLKMTIGANSFAGNPFTISPRLQTGIGFNCPDSFLLFWKTLPGISNYRVYSLGDRYLEPVITTKDSFVVLSRKSNPSLFYTVTPLIGNKEGIKSNTINYTLQGVECYIRAFLSAQVNNTSILTLTLGTLYNINSIILEKFNGINFQPVRQISNNTNLTIIFTDSLTKGLNTYRVKIILTGGGIVYSLPETLYYFSGSDYIIYPNPSAQQNEISIAAKNVDIAVMQVYNSLGIKVFEKILDDRINKIPPGKLSKGVYFIRISNKGIIEDLLKLIVY
jgi:hypothetical protein